MSPPEVSVVVPVRDGQPELGRCVEALLRQSYPAGRFEVIVVDNGSRPPVTDRWGPPVRVVHEGEQGSYAARNRGVAVAAGDVVAFVDADCIPHPGWLEAGVESLRRCGPVVLVAGRVNVTTSGVPSLAELYERVYAFPVQMYADQDFGVTANLFARRSLLESLGRFDSSLRSGGDRELGRRAIAAGGQVIVEPGAIVDHPARATITDLAAKQRRVIAGHVALAHRAGQTRWQLVRWGLWQLRPPVKAGAQVRVALPDRSRRERVGVVMIAWLLRVVAGIETLRLVVLPLPWGGRS